MSISKSTMPGGSVICFCFSSNLLFLLIGASKAKAGTESAAELVVIDS